MNNLYNWIIIIIFVIVFGWSIISNNRYQSLKEDYQELLLDRDLQIDSLIKNNIEKEKSVKNLELQLVKLNKDLDSLYNVKTEIIEKNEFQISSSISNTAVLLKKNLYEMDN